MILIYHKSIKMHIHILVCLYLYTFEDGLKSSYDDVISSIDDFFDQQYPITPKPMEEVYGLQGGLCW